MKHKLYAIRKEKGYLYLKIDKKFLVTEKSIVNFLIDIGFDEDDAFSTFSVFMEISSLTKNVYDWFDSQRGHGIHYYLVIGKRTAHMIFQGRKIEAVNRFIPKYFAIQKIAKKTAKKTIKKKTVKKKTVKKKKTVSRRKKRSRKR